MASEYWSEAHIQAGDLPELVMTSDTGGDGSEDDFDLGARELVIDVR